MSRIKDKWESFDMFTKRIIQAGAVFAVLSTFVGTGWTAFNYFATNDRVDKDLSQVIAMVEGVRDEYRFDKEKARRKELREIIYDCETKYKKDKNEFMEKTCKDAKIELDEREE